MIYVLSDIHGHGERFRSIMEQIDLKPEDTLYILGDVIDRNPDGIRILRQIMRMPNVKMLLGNHEKMMLDALYYPPVIKSRWDTEKSVKQDKLFLWYRNGGDVTHDYLKHIKKTVREEIFRFLDKLPLNIPVEVNGQKFLLIHGGVEANFNKDASRYDDVVTHAVWSRNSHYETVPEDTILIFGHTPTSHFQEGEPLRLWRRGRYIGIDCGAAYEPGRLCCLRLDDMKVFYSE